MRRTYQPRWEIVRTTAGYYARFVAYGRYVASTEVYGTRGGALRATRVIQYAGNIERRDVDERPDAH